MRDLHLRIAIVGVVSLVLGMGTARGQDPAPVKPPMNLWNFLGVPPGSYAKARDNRLNRNGNHPGMEKKPPRLAIADPKNLKSPVPAIAKAAEVKAQEDLAPQKIKAIKYLAMVGCGCYNRDGSITKALVAALDDCTETVRLAAADAIADSAENGPCVNCRERACCGKEIHERLMKMAYDTDAEGCWIEPSERVRRAAARALMACGPPPAPAIIEMPELPPVEGVPPAPMPTPAAPRPATTLDGQETPPTEASRDASESLPPDTTPSAEASGKLQQPNEARGDDSRPQLKSSRRTAQRALPETKTETKRLAPPSMSVSYHPDAARAGTEQPPAPTVELTRLPLPAAKIVYMGEVTHIDLDKGLVFVHTHDECELPFGATVEATHRFLTGRAVVGQLTVVAVEPGSATLRPLSETRLAKISRGDEVLVSRLPERMNSEQPATNSR